MKSFMAALRSLQLPFGKTAGTRINLDGVKGAVLIYDGDDNLIASIAPTAGTDASGKPYREGITSYPPGGPSRLARTAIQLGQNGMIEFFAQPGDRALSNDGYIYGFHPGADDTTGPALSMASPSLTAGQLELFLRSQSKNGADPFYASLYPVGGTAAELDSFRLSVAGAIVPKRRNGSFYEDEVWHPLTPAPGWTLSGAVPGRYRRLSTGMVQLDGVVQQNSGVPPAGTVITTLPAGYRPKQTVLMPLCFDSAAQHGRVLIDTAGAVSIYEAPNALPFLSNITFAVADLT